MKKVVAPFLRAPGNYDVEEASNEAVVPAHLYGESLTVQSMSEDADINVMMERMKVTGKMPDNVRTPVFGDFDGISDYQGALNAVLEAQEEFMKMPGKVRARFENNPQLFLEFCCDIKNRDEMIDMGLMKPEVRRGGAESAGGVREGSGSAAGGESRAAGGGASPDSRAARGGEAGAPVGGAAGASAPGGR